MKLLFDHNLSPDLIRRLAELFPRSNHVYLLNLHEAPDTAVWSYAREHGFIVVSKDADFAEISMVAGFPPKLLWFADRQLHNGRRRDRTSHELPVQSATR